LRKVIFLDIDGVLQPGYSQKRFDIDRIALRSELAVSVDNGIAHLDEYDVAAVYCDWDKKAVERLNNLVDITSAEIVISSAWRSSKNLNQLRSLFKIHKLDTFIADITKVLDSKRVEEIQEYLTRHTDIGTFAILDDDYWFLQKAFPNEIVPCPGIFGEKEFHLAKSILSLNK
jgi:hypothetical protein